MPHIGKTGLITSLPQRAVARSLPVFTGLSCNLFYHLFQDRRNYIKKAGKILKGFYPLSIS